MNPLLALKILEALMSLVATGAVTIAQVETALHSVNTEESDTKALLLVLQIAAAKKAAAQQIANG